MIKTSLILLFSIFLICCNNSTEKESKQKTIDSLTNVIKQKEDSIAKTTKEKEERNKENSFIELRNHVLSKVTTSTPSYEPQSFGGFKNISFSLFNDYNYKLEQVTLKVHYIRQNGDEIKSESLIQTNIKPSQRLTLTAPDYLAGGKKLSITIESVLCKELNLCYYNNGDSIASNDPYKCR